ncbi:hypothetical protein BS78_06G120500 [Paspalum vaginatum]|nr:hypothetical protein BS78_06G120500 [Paspalum vaginatum]
MMSSSSAEIEREDSLDSHLSAGLMEAPTLSSKEIEHAREQALNVLKTKSAEEAFKVFTKGSSEVKADLPKEEKAETAAMPPRKGGDTNANVTVQTPQKN